MHRKYETYAPQDVSELIDVLAMTLSRAPTFEDDLSPEDSIDTIYVALEKGLRAIQASIGAAKYTRLSALAAETRKQFESDPNDENGGTDAGRRLIHEMEDILLNRSAP